MLSLKADVNSSKHLAYGENNALGTAASEGRWKRVREIPEDWSDSEYDEFINLDPNDVRRAENPEDTSDHVAFVKLLLEHGADPNTTESGDYDYSSPLTEAVNSIKIEIIKLLLEYGAAAPLQFPATEREFPLEPWKCPVETACYIESPT